jgi:hypothetical protein
VSECQGCEQVPPRGKDEKDGDRSQTFEETAAGSSLDEHERRTKRGPLSNTARNLEFFGVEPFRLKNRQGSRRRSYYMGGIFHPLAGFREGRRFWRSPVEVVSSRIVHGTSRRTEFAVQSP